MPVYGLRGLQGSDSVSTRHPALEPLPNPIPLKIRFPTNKADKKMDTLNWEEVRKGQVAAVEGDPLSVWFHTDDLNGDTDALHYMEGYKGLGERFCAKAVELIKKQKP